MVQIRLPNEPGKSFTFSVPRRDYYSSRWEQQSGPTGGTTEPPFQTEGERDEECAPQGYLRTIRLPLEHVGYAGMWFGQTIGGVWYAVSGEMVDGSMIVCCFYILCR